MGAVLCRRQPTLHRLAALGAVTLILVLGVWPFAALGHTSAMATVLAASPAVVMLATATWAAREKPLWLAYGSVLFYVAGSYWFPLVPFCLVGMGVLCVIAYREVPRDARFRTVFLVLTAVFMAFLLLRVGQMWFSAGASELLNPNGRTRVATPDFLVFWLLLTVLGVGSYAYKGVTTGKIWYNVNPLGWFLAGGLAIISGVFFIGGRLSGGQGTYSSDKLTLVVVLATFPVLVLLLATVKRAITLGLYLGILAVPVSAFFLVQNDFGSNMWSSPLLAGATPNDAQLKIVKAIEEGADQIFCVPDRDTGAEQYLGSYQCSRWAASLTGSDGDTTADWRYAFLSRVPQDELGKVVDSVGRDSNTGIVVVPAEGDKAITDKPWWDQWIPDGWTRY